MKLYVLEEFHDIFGKCTQSFEPIIYFNLENLRKKADELGVRDKDSEGRDIWKLVHHGWPLDTGYYFMISEVEIPNQENMSSAPVVGKIPDRPVRPELLEKSDKPSKRWFKGKKDPLTELVAYLANTDLSGIDNEEEAYYHARMIMEIVGR